MSGDGPTRSRGIWDRLFRAGPEPVEPVVTDALASLFAQQPAPVAASPLALPAAEHGGAIEREPPVGTALAEHVRDGRHRDRVALAAAATVARGAFFVADGPDGWRCEQEKFMRSPQARSFTSAAAEAFAFANLELLNSEGVVLLDGVAMRDSVDYVTPTPADASVEWARPYEYLKLRRPVAFAPTVPGSTLIGYAAAWRNWGHWLLQCMPKLVAFLSLRAQVPGLRVALPPLPSGSAFAQTVELLGIRPEEVLTVPTPGATRFATGYAMANPSIWDISPLAGSGADLIAVRLGPAALGGAERVYLHRAGASTRRVANFAEVRALVERFGFAVHSFEDASLAEQVRVMRSARCVIAEHGSATTNILFCRRRHARAATVQSDVRGAVFSGASPPRADWTTATWSGGRPTRRTQTTTATMRCRSSGWRRRSASCSAMRPPRSLHPRRRRQAGSADLRSRNSSQTAGIGRFGTAGRDERLLIFGPASSPPPLPVLNEHELPESFLAEHRVSPAAPAVFVSAVDDAEVWGNGLVVRNGRFIAPADCFPAYLRASLAPTEHLLSAVHRGALGRPDVGTVTATEPVLVALHPNLTYGYFLSEMLPRLFVAKVLRQFGAVFRLALPARLPAMVEAYVGLLGLGDGALRYDPDAERIKAPSVLLASMMQIDGHLHPAINLAVEALVAPFHAAGARTRLFIWRGEDEDGNLLNRDEIAAALAEDGFIAIDPQHMPLTERLSLLARAEVIVGDCHAGLKRRCSRRAARA